MLQLKALGVDNVMTFDYLAPPPAQAMVKAAELLFSLGAIDEKSRHACNRSHACTFLPPVVRHYVCSGPIAGKVTLPIISAIHVHV